MLCVHIYIFNRKISATFDSEKQYPVIQETKDNMKKTPALSNYNDTDCREPERSAQL